MAHAPRQPTSSGPPPTKVFISYARADSAFADRLVAALEDRGLDVLIDRRDLPLLEKWQAELLDFIRQSDAVIYIATPAAVRSQWCAWEIEQVTALGKRLAPVALDRAIVTTLPPALGAYNLVFFDDPAGFDARCDQIAGALQSNIGWVKTHTRLGERARLWDDAGRPRSARLLSRPEVGEAAAWLLAQPKLAPDPTELIRTYIAASQGGLVRQRRLTLIAGATSVVIASGLLSLAYFQFRSAGEQQAIASQRSLQTQQARRQQSELLTREAANRLASDPRLAINLALEALPDPLATDAERRGWPYVSDAETILYRALQLDAEKLPVQNDFVRLAAHTKPVATVAISPDAKWVLTGSTDNSAARWNAIVNALPLQTFENGQSGIQAVAFSPDGKRALIASRYRHSELYDVEKTFLPATLVAAGDRERNGNLEMVEFSPDARRYVLVFQEGAELHSAADGALIARFASPQDHRGSIRTGHFNADGTKLVTSASGGSVLIWDGMTGKPLPMKIAGPKAYYSSARFSPDGAMIASAHSDGSGRLWDATTGMQRFELKCHEQDVFDALFSGDGKLLVTVANDLTPPCVWDTATGLLARKLTGQNGSIKTALLAPDGNHLVAAMGIGDHSVRIWDIRTGALRAILLGHTGAVRALTMDPAGTWIASGSEDNTARLWPYYAGLGDIVARGKRAVAVCLNETERRQFSLDPVPPRWCVTGPGLETERNPAKWKPLHPYDGKDWTDWLVAIDAGGQPQRPSR